MPPEAFEATIQANERRLTRALDRADTAIGKELLGFPVCPLASIKIKKNFIHC
jgi:hypothetical protein